MSTPSLIQVESIDQNTNEADFEERFEFTAQPALLKGFCRSWPAFKKWTLEYFEQECGRIEVPLSNYRLHPYQKAREKRRIYLKDYIRSLSTLESGTPEETMNEYVAGWHYLKSKPTLSADCIVPSFFQNNWIERVQPFINFDWTSIFIGHSHVESPLHTDSFFVATWLAVLKGTKVMRLIPAEYTGPVRNNLNVFDEAIVQHLHSLNIPVYEMTIRAGDIAYIPPGWWHHVRNVDITVAVSNNFVSKHNFLVFEQQIRAKFLKPLIELAKLKDEAILQSSKMPGLLEHFQPIRGTIKSARYIENERKYVQYFSTEMSKTVRLLDHCQKSLDTK